MNPLGGLEKFLLSLLAVMVALGAFGWYVSSAEKNKLMRHADEARAKLEATYAAKELDWNTRIDAAEAQKALDAKHIEDLSLQPTRAVVYRVCGPASRTPATTKGQTADGGHADPAAAGGLLPTAPGPSPQSGGLSDAGPGLRQDALMCELIAERLRAWQTRYSITQQ